MTLKNNILKKLLAANGVAISGQDLADEFQVSRTAIWKAMKALEEEGYQIQSVRKIGYSLEENKDTVTAPHIQHFLKASTYGKVIHHYDSLDTTQRVAHQLASEGATDGTLVIAEEQLQGKGRMARPWASSASKGIWMSLIIKPTLTPQQAPQLTLVAAVSIVRAIESVCKIRPVIKWPNDLLLNGKKITGILTELQAEPDIVKAIIIGMGINVNQDRSDFPEELAEIATSLKIESGQTFNRSELVAAVLEHFEQLTTVYLTEGFNPIKTLWESYSNTIGKSIRVVMLHEIAEGQAVGITEEGMLQLKQQDGSIRLVYSGDIELKE